MLEDVMAMLEGKLPALAAGHVFVSFLRKALLRTHHEGYMMNA
jgi:hypothetical protein